MSYREAEAEVRPLYVTFNGRVLAYDAETGRELWSHVADSPMEVPKMIADEGRLYVLTTERLTAIEGLSGRGLWSTAVEGGCKPAEADLARYGTSVLVRSRGRLFAYSSYDGKARWRGRASSIVIPGRDDEPR